MMSKRLTILQEVKTIYAFFQATNTAIYRFQCLKLFRRASDIRYYHRKITVHYSLASFRISFFHFQSVFFLIASG